MITILITPFGKWKHRKQASSVPNNCQYLLGMNVRSLCAGIQGIPLGEFMWRFWVAVPQILLCSFASEATSGIGIRKVKLYPWELTNIFAWFLWDMPHRLCSPGNYGLLVRLFLQGSSCNIHRRISVYLFLVSSTCKWQHQRLYL